MSIVNKFLLATPIALCVACFALQASAQITPQRDAAIERCIAQAHQQWPGGSQEAHQQRVATYKACMTAAGQNP